MKNMEMARRGELEAEKFLVGKGYQVLERNWYHRHKEIDLIAVDGQELVIVEVKTRKAPVLDNPSLAIGRDKQRNLIYAANAYARWNRIKMEVRFDIVWIVYRGEQAVVEHYKNAFVPGLN